MSKDNFIKCRNHIFNKKDLMYISREGSSIAIYLVINNETYTLKEWFETREDAIKECDNIFEQLQEVEKEEVKCEKDTITLTEFWNSKKPMAIQCEDFGQAVDLLNAFDSLGKKNWKEGDTYFYQTICKFGEHTCYTNLSTMSSKENLEDIGYHIYKFKDVDLDN